MKRLFAALFISAWSLLGCSAPSPSAAPSPSSPAAPAEARPTLLSMRAVKQHQGAEVDLEMGARLHNGDNIAYYVRADGDAYVSVLQFFPDGTQAVIYPPPGVVLDIAGGAETRVPPAGWLQVVGCPGPEHAFVVAAAQPLETSDPELAKLVDEVRRSPSSDEQACPNDAPGPAPAPADPPPAVSTGPAPLKAPPPAPPAPIAATKPPAPAPRPAAKPRPVMVALMTRSACLSGDACAGTRALKFVGNAYQSSFDERGVAVIAFSFDHAPPADP